MKLSPTVLERLTAVLEERGLLAGYDGAWRDVLQHVIEAFRELWYELHESPDGTRSYLFLGDDLPVIVFYGRLQSTVIYDFAIVEEIVEIYHFAVMEET